MHRDRPIATGQRVLPSAQNLQGLASIQPCFGRVRHQRDRSVATLERILVTAELQQERAAVDQCRDQIGHQRERTLIGVERFVRTLQVVQDVSAIGVRLCEALIAGDRVIAACKRILDASGFSQRHAQRVVGGGMCGSQGDGSSEMLDGILEFAEMAVRERGQVQGIDVFWLATDDLGAAIARVRKGALLVMINCFLEQERRVACRHNCLPCLPISVDGRDWKEKQASSTSRHRTSSPEAETAFGNTARPVRPFFAKAPKGILLRIEVAILRSALARSRMAERKGFEPLIRL
jgi:hypothetical protein